MILHEEKKEFHSVSPYWLSIRRNISFQNARWPDTYPALSLSPELPSVPALTLLRWREVCPLRGQVSPGIILLNSKITFPSIGHSQATAWTPNPSTQSYSWTTQLYLVLFWPPTLFLFSSRTDLVPPLPVTRTVDMTGSSTATSQVSFRSLEQCFIQGTHYPAQVQSLWIWSFCQRFSCQSGGLLRVRVWGRGQIALSSECVKLSSDTAWAAVYLKNAVVWLHVTQGQHV